MKNATRILFLLASVSFAKPPIPPPDIGTPPGNIFLNTICIYNQLTYLLYAAESNYWIYDGKGCVNPDLGSHDSAILDAFYGDGSPGLVYLYQSVLWACEEGYNTKECYDAMHAFYPAARQAKNTFSAAKAAYITSAKQAMYANSMGLCKNSPEQISEHLRASTETYWACMRNLP